MPLYQFVCKECGDTFEAICTVDDVIQCRSCCAEVKRLISPPASLTWECSVNSSSMGKPVSTHPRGSNFAWGKEIERVKKEKKDMNAALKKGKKFKTGNRVDLKGGKK